MNFANLASFQGIEFADLSFCVDLPRLACVFASEMNVQGSVRIRHDCFQSFFNKTHHSVNYMLLTKSGNMISKLSQ